MTDEKDFIKKKIVEKGFPLENYIQGVLLKNKWSVQPNAYFLDRDTEKGRELDIRADFELHEPLALFLFRLLIQCKKIPGNAWIFFPHSGFLELEFYPPISWFNTLRFLGYGDIFEMFSARKTHFERSETVASNYCEIITDPETSNKKDSNIWESVITLIKATSEELEEAKIDDTKFFEEEITYNEFVKNPTEVIRVVYPLIVFEGKMFEASFSGDEIILEDRQYVQLYVDYKSGRYEGRFAIDVITKDLFPKYVLDIMADLSVFNKRREEKAEEYTKFILRELKKRYGYR